MIRLLIALRTFFLLLSEIISGQLENVYRKEYEALPPGQKTALEWVIKPIPLMKNGNYFSLCEGYFGGTNGKLCRYRMLVANKPSVSVMILDKDGKIILTQQTRMLFEEDYKYASLEFVAGAIDGDETPEAAARREVLEETGYTGTLIPLNHSPVYPSGSEYTNTCYYFLMVEAQRADQTHTPDATEEIEVVTMSHQEFKRTVFNRNTKQLGSADAFLYVNYILAQQHASEHLPQ